MIIKNLTKNTILATQLSFALTPLRRLKGLLGAKEILKNCALIIKPCFSIHTFFMNFPIDVLFVDKHNKVLKTLPSLKPFRITPAYFNSALAIELPAGTIESSITSLGDSLLIE